MTNGRELELIAGKSPDFVHCVKLFNVPYEISDAMLVEVIGKFGKVHEIRKDLVGDGEWKIPNGNRMVFMEIDEALPINIEVFGQRIKVFSPSLAKVCFLCGGVDHSKKSCMKNQPMQEKLNGTTKSTPDLTENVIVININESLAPKLNTASSMSGKVNELEYAEDDDQTLTINCADPDDTKETVSMWVLGTCQRNQKGRGDGDERIKKWYSFDPDEGRETSRLVVAHQSIS